MSTVKISFWRIFWPTLVSSMILSVFGWIFWLIVFGSIFGNEPDSKDSSVLHMTLAGAIGERSSSSINPSSISMDKTTGLADILMGLEKAKEDKRVKGIYLELGNVQCGYATAMEIRNGLKDFKKSGKFIVAYLNGEVITQKQYYISSVSNEVYGFSTSAMEFIGLGGELMFFKNTFDKLGIEMQVIRGSNNDFKSAVEPYFRTDMSDSSRVQTQRYMSSIWEDVRSQIAADRKVTAAQLNDIAENAKIQRVDDAVKLKLIDGAKYRDEVEEIVLKKSGLKNLKDIMAFEDYAKKGFKNKQLAYSDGSATANIAVIVGEGGITVDGDEMTSDEICKYFREVRNDDDIKVVVFRVNSPGGSALASEEIWREVSLTTKKKKVIVSMGDVAASGGYYVATPASTIFAEPTTITGSIGVFGVIPYTGGFMENKLGLTFDRVQTNKHSVLSTNRKLSPEELTLIQGEVDQIYLQFKKRVADGRGLKIDQVHRIARGRVWTGADALKIGLVDKLGGFNDALAFAIKEAKVKKAQVIYYPKVKEDPIEDLFEQLSKEDQESVKIKQNAVPKVIEDLTKRLMKLDSYTGIQMRMPFDIDLH
ncbi:signal peptide peptidase SppA [Fluviicola taffensis]|uniref:Signal peptide peptidase SppA, 67K type n=1 Tax=Fluviicola taffensis (strain DSM 16823 / NCIMB 13979 / RW262) TaxID=755732 RepID=F2IDV5_FLUTR|nr:signal peptide peptidase SppA [Fluviicola taffensis]AEA44497.1 signal peptide peptidase SppA, 67K type [Fluviicola taffensis DSM 16823]